MLSWGVAWGRCLRVRVMLDVIVPLIRGTSVVMGGNKTAVLFCYEKLYDFCYFCGRLNHVDKDCLLSFDVSGGGGRRGRQFGPWLRAEGRRGISFAEVGVFLESSVVSGASEPIDGGSSSQDIDALLRSASPPRAFSSKGLHVQDNADKLKQLLAQVPKAEGLPISLLRKGT